MFGFWQGVGSILDLMPAWDRRSTQWEVRERQKKIDKLVRESQKRETWRWPKR